MKKAAWTATAWIALAVPLSARAQTAREQLEALAPAGADAPRVETPAVASRAAARNLRMRSSRSADGSVLTRLNGGEPAVLRRIELVVPPSSIMSEPLPIFTGQLRRRLKFVLENKLYVRMVLRSLGADHMADESIGRGDLGKVLQTNAKYTFILTDRELVFLRSGERLGETLFSRHIVLADYEPARFGGELWMDEAGTLHLDNYSGTYHPSTEDLLKAKEVFERNFELPRVETHAYAPGKSSGPADGGGESIP